MLIVSFGLPTGRDAGTKKSHDENRICKGIQLGQFEDLIRFVSSDDCKGYTKFSGKLFGFVCLLKDIPFYGLFSTFSSIRI